MTTIIPSRTTKKVMQNNRSKILGDLWSSFNIDLQTNLGLIRVSPRLQINTKDVANQGISVAFKTFDQLVFTVAGTRIFKNAAFNLVSPFVEDVSTGSITTYSSDYSDMETFNDTLVATSTDKVMSKVGGASGAGAWTQRASLSAADSLHKLCYFIKFNRIYYIDSYQNIKSMDTSWSEATSGDYYIHLDYRSGIPYTLNSDGTDIWIGTVKTTNLAAGDSTTGGSILRWDGISSQITTEYKVKAKGVLALCKDDTGVMHAIDSNGALLRFTGSGFEEVSRLPLNKKYLINALSSKYNSFIHPNGFYFTRNGTFIVLVNNLVGDNGSTIKEDLASGIWEYSKDTGFVHKQSLSYNPVGTSTITDYGQNRVSQVGALAEANIYSNSATGKPTLICGAIQYTDSSSTSTAIFVDDPLDNVQKYGYFVTTWITAVNIKDSWERVILKYRKLLDSADKIIMKYRLTESSSTEITLTWAGLSLTTSTFTTSTDLSALIGYEVEIIQGTGSGKCAHIVSVSGSGTYTVILDEPFTGITTGTAKARIQNWVKLLTVSDQGSESKKASTGKASERIQIKVCMQFTGENEFNELIVLNNSHESIT